MTGDSEMGGWLGARSPDGDRKVSAGRCGTRAPEPGPTLNITRPIVFSVIVFCSFPS